MGIAVLVVAFILVARKRRKQSRPSPSTIPELDDAPQPEVAELSTQLPAGASAVAWAKPKQPEVTMRPDIPELSPDPTSRGPQELPSPVGLVAYPNLQQKDIGWEPVQIR